MAPGAAAVAAATAAGRAQLRRLVAVGKTGKLKATGTGRKQAKSLPQLTRNRLKPTGRIRQNPGPTGGNDRPLVLIEMTAQLATELHKGNGTASPPVPGLLLALIGVGHPATAGTVLSSVVGMYRRVLTDVARAALIVQPSGNHKVEVALKTHYFRLYSQNRIIR